MKSRTYNDRYKATPKPNKGGGDRHVEDSTHLSIKETYQRMLRMGDIQRNMRLKTQGLDKNAARKLIKSAAEAPNYLNQKQIDTRINQIKDAVEKTNILKKQKIENTLKQKTQQEIDKAVKKELEKQTKNKE